MYIHPEDPKHERAYWRRVGFGVFIVLALLLILLPGCAEDPKAKYEQIRQSVYLIEHANGTGSGVMVGQFLMLTAAHVIKDAKSITVGPKKLPAKVLKVDDKLDIALLHVAIACPCAPFADTPKADDSVAIIGFPVYEYVQMQVATEGQIQGVSGNRLQVTAAAAGGNSGGGVFVYQDGQWKLAGILVEVMGWCMGYMQCFPMPHLSRAVDTATMMEFMKGAA